MKIEARKYYRTADNRKVGPMRVGDASGVSWIDGRSAGTDPEWHTDSGIVRIAGEENYPSIVAEWVGTPNPVRTVSRKEIVPGTYGKVIIATGPMHHVTPWVSCEGNLAADELRAAADVFTQLADALEDQK